MSAVLVGSPQAHVGTVSYFGGEFRKHLEVAEGVRTGGRRQPRDKMNSLLLALTGVLAWWGHSWSRVKAPWNHLPEGQKGWLFAHLLAPLTVAVEGACCSGGTDPLRGPHPPLSQASSR